jgi:anti-sigma factor RsiW
VSCELMRELLEPFVDGELDPIRQADVREHLAGCAACTALHQELQKLSEDLRRQAPYFRAPTGLRDRIRKSLRPASAPWRWSALAAMILLAFSIAANVILLRSRSSQQQLLAEAIVASHVRSMIGTHLFDVASTDQHTVKPWFNGRVDYAPEVHDFSDKGFALVGGRVEFIDNRRVATLVYQRRQHVINVFVWPDSTDLAAQTSVRNGYNVIHWSKAGATWWLASDLNINELKDLAHLLGD